MLLYYVGLEVNDCFWCHCGLVVSKYYVVVIIDLFKCYFVLFSFTYNVVENYKFEKIN